MLHKTAGSFTEVLSISATAWIFASAWRGKPSSTSLHFSGGFLFVVVVIVFLFLRTLSSQNFASQVALQCLQTDIVCIFSSVSSCSWREDHPVTSDSTFTRGRIPTQLVFWASTSFSWDSGDLSYFLWALKLNDSRWLCVPGVSVSFKNQQWGIYFVLANILTFIIII